MAAIKKISVADVEYVAHRLAKELMDWDEPIPDFETRFPEKLESAINTPFQTFDRKSLYKGLRGKAAALFYFMIKDHPFQNGNKRVAVTTLLYFLSSNGYWIMVDNDSLYDFAKSVAGSSPRLKDSVLRMIEGYLEVAMAKKDFNA
jgi:death on curing protein